MTRFRVTLALAASAFLATPALAQQAGQQPGQQPGQGQGSSMDQMPMAAPDLPEACRAAAQAGGRGGSMQGSGMQGGMMQDMQGMMAGMSAAQKGLMEAMMKMHPAMMAGMMAGDADVAWACSMIPHHQGAIDMSRAVLQGGGDNAEARKLAQKTISDQEKDIAELRRWLEQHAKAEGND